MPRCLCRLRPRLLPRRMMALLRLPRRPLAAMARGSGTGTVGMPTSTIHAWTPTATSMATGSTARASTPMTQRSGATSPLMPTTSCSKSRRPRAASTARARRARLQDHQDPTTTQVRGPDQLEADRLSGQLRSLIVRLELHAVHQHGACQTRPRLPSRQYRRRDPIKGKTTGAGEADGIREMVIGGDEDPQSRHPHGPAVAAPEREEERLCGLRAGSRGGGDRRVPSVYRPILAQECFALLLVYICTERCGCGLEGVLRAPPRGE